LVGQRLRNFRLVWISLEWGREGKGGERKGGVDVAGRRLSCHWAGEEKGGRRAETPENTWFADTLVQPSSGKNCRAVDDSAAVEFGKEEKGKKVRFVDSASSAASLHTPRIRRCISLSWEGKKGGDGRCWFRTTVSYVMGPGKEERRRGGRQLRFDELAVPYVREEKKKKKGRGGKI